jgi:endonuclease-3
VLGKYPAIALPYQNQICDCEISYETIKGENQMDTQKLVEEILDYGQKLDEQNVQNDFVDADNFPEWVPANKLLTENTFAFLLGVIYDEQRAQRAWRYPYQLQKKVTELSPKYIASISLEHMDKIFESTKPKLHYWRKASVWTLRAAYKVCRFYDGDTSRIWTDGSPSPQEIQRRFDEFDGIGQKKSSMATNILYRKLKWLNASENELKEIDVSYDKHVRQVFLRTGITDTDNEESIIRQARILSPKYPGALDFPSWYIGQKFCNNEPKCEQCPLDGVCAKRTKYIVRKKKTE